MYEHRHQQTQVNNVVSEANSTVLDKLANLQSCMLNIETQNHQLNQDNEVLNNNNALIMKIRTLEEQLNVVQSQSIASQFAPRGMTTTSHPQYNVVNTPVYNGNKGDITLEEWLLKLKEWFPNKGIKNKGVKISASMQFWGRGAYAFMHDYPKKVANKLNGATKHILQ